LNKAAMSYAEATVEINLVN